MTTRYHPSIFICGVVACLVLAHNTDGRMQALGAGIMVFASVLFILCTSGRSQ